MYRLSSAVVLTVTISTLAAPLPKNHVEIDYFPLVKGNTWEYTRSAGMARDKWKVTVAEVTPQDGKTIAVLKCELHNTSFDERIAADRNGVQRQDIKLGFETPMTVIPYPFKEGASWDSPLPLPYYRGFETYKAKAKGLVEVEVPAGKFRAMEVVLSGEFEIEGRKETITSWYAPGVGLAKQYSEAPGGAIWTLELNKFTPGK